MTADVVVDVHLQPEEVAHALADRYEGKRFNGPNDVVVKSDGSIYFTDPNGNFVPNQWDLAFAGVYRVSADLGLTGNGYAAPGIAHQAPNDGRPLERRLEGQRLKEFHNARDRLQYARRSCRHRQNKRQSRHLGFHFRQIDGRVSFRS